MRKTLLFIVTLVLVLRPLALRFMPELHENEYALRLTAAWADYIIQGLCLTGGIIFCIKLLLQGRQVRIHRATDISILLFLAVALLSLLYSIDIDMSVKALIWYISLFSFMYLVQQNVETGQNEVRQFTNLFLALCAVISVYAVWQYFYLYHYIRSHIQELATPEMIGHGRWDLVMQMIELRRIGGTFGAPNIFAGFLGLAIPAGIALSFYEKGKRKAIFIALTAAMSLAMLFTFSIGGWLALTAAVAAEVFLLSSMYRNRAKQIAILACSAILICAVVFTMVKKRANPITAGSIKGRTAYLAAALEDVKDNYLKGTGIGTFPLAYIKYKLPGAEYETMHAHNSYLELLSEVGIAGFLAFLVFIGSVLYCGYRLIRRSEGYDKYLAVGLLSGILTFLLHNIGEFTFFASEVTIFWYFLIGLLLALPKREKNITLHPFSVACAAAVLLVSLIAVINFSAADIYFYKGVEASRAGRFNEAIAELRRANSMNPKDSRYIAELKYALSRIRPSLSPYANDVIAIQ